jgi:aryl-alcohol dehydrogenase-like predicted oxidoreductase
MRYRNVARLGWSLSEIGHGLWGMGGWTESDDNESSAALDRAVDRGCNFFDTALAYGNGHSERLLGALVRRYPAHRLFVATKVPPKNWKWPGRGSTPVAETFPYDHIVESTETSLSTLGMDAMDLQQLHVWDDAWAPDEGWQRAAQDLKARGLIRAFGISVNRWEPSNVLRALDTGLVDFVQVVYNVFDQAPEDVLFPVCQRAGIGVIARVPFDEGSLTGTLTPASRWPDGDFRNIYFAAEKLADTLPRVEAVRQTAARAATTLPDLALRFTLSHPAVTTVIPGMRKVAHVDANLAASDAPPLDASTLASLRTHRWDRQPDARP